VYSVRLPGLTSSTGNVQVTPYGAEPARCVAASWQAADAAEAAEVRCFSLDGQPRDSRFTMSFADQSSLVGRSRRFGYALANDPASPSYAAPMQHSYNWVGLSDSVAPAGPCAEIYCNPVGDPINILRQATGRYQVTFPHLAALPDSAQLFQVTPTGTAPASCNATRTTRSGEDAVVAVACFNPQGRPADAPFSIAHLNDSPLPAIAFTSDRSGGHRVFTMTGAGTVRLPRTRIPASRNPAWSPDGTRIAFTSNRAGNDEIFVMRSDGTGVRRLTRDGGDRFPAWSPDGTRIAFTRTPHSSAGGIYVMRSDGTGAARLTEFGDDWAPSWSPDGARIAFGNGTALFTMNADGGGRAYIGESGGFPRWSPDGTKLLYTRNGFPPRISFTNADGTPAEGIAPGVGAGSEAGPASWSPDGTRIAYTTNDHAIAVASLDGASQTVLTQVDTGGDEDPAWAPDGSRIAFASGRGGGGRHLWVMRADGSGLRQVTTGAGEDGEPAWAPDGSSIVFTSNRGGDDDIYLMRPDGSGLRQVTSGAGDDGEPAWAPDGSSIAFVSNRGGDDDIYLMRPDGEDQVDITNDPAVQDRSPTWAPSFAALIQP
jgi:Tol biopolymer transport system component